MVVAGNRAEMDRRSESEWRTERITKSKSVYSLILPVQCIAVWNDVLKVVESTERIARTTVLVDFSFHAVERVPRFDDGSSFCWCDVPSCLSFDVTSA